MSEDPTLKRHLDLVDILLFGVGGMVGAGIYAIIGEAAALAGNALWLSFGLAALVSLLTALSYAEFVSRFPDAGGSYEYIKQSFGDRYALGASLLMLFTGVVAAAAIAISFSEYLSRLLELPSWITTIGIISLMGLVNILGVQESSWFNNLATVVTLAGLAAVVVFSFEDWGRVDLLTLPDAGIQGVLGGSALIFFSFVGYEDLVKMAEETREPEITMPRGVLISGVIVLVLYLLIAVSAVSVLGAVELSKSDGPLAAVLAAKAGEAWVTALIIVALFATSKTILSNILGTSRLVYDIARDSGYNWLRKATHISRTTGTPVSAIIAITIVSVGFGMIGNLKTVASISNIFIFCVFLNVNLALIRFRLSEAGREKAPFQVPFSVSGIPAPTVVAILGVLVLLYFNVLNAFS